MRKYLYRDATTSRKRPPRPSSVLTPDKRQKLEPLIARDTHVTRISYRKLLDKHPELGLNLHGLKQAFTTLRIKKERPSLPTVVMPDRLQALQALIARNPHSARLSYPEFLSEYPELGSTRWGLSKAF